MPTTHAQRVARARRPRTSRTDQHTLYAMSVIPVRDVVRVEIRWQYADAKSSRIMREAARRGRRVIDLKASHYDAADLKGIPTIHPFTETFRHLPSIDEAWRTYEREQAKWLLEQPFLSTLFQSPRAWAGALDAYVNKTLDPSWDEALRTDETDTPFMPEDWRLECVAERDALPEYEGTDLDGLFV